jgi:hypothetical protein
MQNKKQNQTGNSGDLNHPGRENWMGYLYNEIPRREKAVLDAHLENCDECRAQVRNWQATMGMLDAGQLPERARGWTPRPLLKWGMAAALVLLLGFAAGRFTSPGHAEVKALRASLKSELKTELLAELRQEQQTQLDTIKLDAEEKRALDRKSIYNAIGSLDNVHKADYASLRKELETVALLTQDGFQQEQQQMVTLASLSQPNR